MLSSPDVLNRFPYTAEDVSSEESTDLSTVRVMMYIFPRQFGLHNVFTNQPNPRETVQPFKDYTIREDEINSKYSSPSTIKIPKRLRGKAARLVQKLQVKHSRCAYKELLEYYCPVSPIIYTSTNADLPDIEPRLASSYRPRISVRIRFDGIQDTSFTQHE